MPLVFATHRFIGGRFLRRFRLTLLLISFVRDLLVDEQRREAKEDRDSEGGSDDHLPFVDLDFSDLQELTLLGFRFCLYVFR
jgi:hypothetical protein